MQDKEGYVCVGTSPLSAVISHAQKSVDEEPYERPKTRRSFLEEVYPMERPETRRSSQEEELFPIERPKTRRGGYERDSTEHLTPPSRISPLSGLCIPSIASKIASVAQKQIFLSPPSSARSTPYSSPRWTPYSSARSTPRASPSVKTRTPTSRPKSVSISRTRRIDTPRVCACDSPGVKSKVDGVYFPPVLPSGLPFGGDVCEKCWRGIIIHKNFSVDLDNTISEDAPEEGSSASPISDPVILPRLSASKKPQRKRASVEMKVEIKTTWTSGVKKHYEQPLGCHRPERKREVSSPAPREK